MFDLKCVNTVMDDLQKNAPFFASEAQFQMSFAAKVLQLYGKQFVVIPEYPLMRGAKRDEIDLMIIDTEDSNKTLIEFKHKTLNIASNPIKVPLYFDDTVINNKWEPTNMGAPELGVYDCWSDIERLEWYSSKKECAKAYFIFLTNDPRYWDKAVGRTRQYMKAMSLADADRKAGKMLCSWQRSDGSPIPSSNPTPTEKNSIGANRIANPLTIKGLYREPFVLWKKISGWTSSRKGTINPSEYKKLVLEIK